MFFINHTLSSHIVISIIFHSYKFSSLTSFLFQGNSFNSKVRLFNKLLNELTNAGEVVVFLDCHCEAMPGWLEPLLERIQENNKVVAIPVIDNIDWNDFKWDLALHIVLINSFNFVKVTTIICNYLVFVSFIFSKIQ